MGVWDATTPVGTEAINLGDDRIRELKVAIEEALSHEDSTFPGASPATAPIFIPGFLRGTTASRPTGGNLVIGRLYINTTLGIIERYNGATWDPVGAVFPAGTAMLFYQASAPVGWTAVAQNNKFLRVVSAGGTGGSAGGSGLTPSSTITLAHTHTVDSHTHTTPDHQHNIDLSGVSAGFGIGTAIVSNDSAGAPLGVKGAGAANVREHLNRTANSGSGVSGGTAPATDSKLADIAFQYVDIIIATKD